jgi:salicylate hydroxylase
MVPHQGTGAGQAVEDAYVLSSLLLRALAPIASASPPKHELLLRAETALKVYDQIRVPVTHDAARRAVNNGQLITLAEGKEAQEAEEMQRRVEKIWHWGEFSYPRATSRSFMLTWGFSLDDKCG